MFLQATPFWKAYCNVDEYTGSATHMRVNQAQQYIRQLLLLSGTVKQHGKVAENPRPDVHCSGVIAVALPCLYHF